MVYLTSYQLAKQEYVLLGMPRQLSYIMAGLTAELISSILWTPVVSDVNTMDN
jgi:hypothetical protein